MTTSDLPASDTVELLHRASPSIYGELLRDARTSGRTPVWVSPRGDNRFGVLAVPDDPISAVDAHDPYRVLAEWWPGPCPDGCACLAPFTGELPALTRAGRADRSTSRRAIEEATSTATDLRACGDVNLVVVPVTRPADIPAAVGWGGICNYDHQDNVRLSAVLRSWEERFGAVLTVMTESRLLVSVAYPPTTVREAEHVATEHFAFCPDQVDPQNGTVYTPGSYAREIRNARWWRFWWD